MHACFYKAVIYWSLVSHLLNNLKVSGQAAIIIIYLKTIISYYKQSVVVLKWQV